MTDTSIISVVIPVYNTAKYLPECLDSLIKQTFTAWEAICVDDCSSDNSLKILRTYAKKDKRIKIIKHLQNKGCVITKDEAIRKATGKYIYPLDSDDKILPETLQKLYNAIENHLGDIISSEVMLFGNQSGKLELPYPNIYNFANCNCIVNASLFKKEDYLQLPNDGYDINFSSGLEDYDLWLNFIFNLHKKIYRIPEILYYYRIKDEKESRNMLNADNHQRLKEYLRIKYPDMNVYINQQAFLNKAEQLVQLQNQILQFQCQLSADIKQNLLLLQYKKKYVKLFKFIPFLKLKTKRKTTKIYLFGFIPIFKIIRK